MPRKDTLTREQRFRCMSQIRSKHTVPERAVRKHLTSLGYRYRLHDPKLVGKPDVVLKKHMTAIFVNGCFWHQHRSCKRAVLPKSNRSYWVSKLEKNVRRQNSVKRKLRSEGWHVIIVWECQTRDAKKTEKALESLRK